MAGKSRNDGLPADGIPDWGEKMFTGTSYTNRTRSLFAGKVCLRWNRTVALLSFVFLFPSAGFALSGEYYLYRPNEVSGGTESYPEDGVLVKKILIRQGDTLSTLSRRYAGKSAYYPQILLFNRIPNPNLIIAGDQLLVPLFRDASRENGRHPGTVVSTERKRNHRSRPSQRRAGPDRGARPAGAERFLYDNALALFNKGEYDKAIDAFSRFLKKYPHSSLAPEAGLHRADCYLKLSGE
jgi:tetratricopeptide (TPR) repeat protein